ncbi:MAG: hypothetical protein HYV97_14030 [Bdellovibrio sp.]|nr:hypothetical protein [Bdellovibrio sp.]
MFKNIKKKKLFKDSKIFSSKILLIFMAAIGLASLFLMFRLKNVELDYEIAAITKQIDLIKTENRDLHARRARLLSSENLKKLAWKLGFVEPKAEKIIVVP